MAGLKMRGAAPNTGAAPRIFPSRASLPPARRPSSRLPHRGPHTLKPTHALAPPASPTVTESQSPRPATPHPDRSTWFQAWWAVAAIDALDDTRPNPLEIMGEKLVAWKGADGAWVVQSDRCPHRAAPLSDGFVRADRGAIVCAYHGYEFSGCGNCTKITSLSHDPAAEATACASKRSRVRTLPTTEAAGLLFVWPDPYSDAAADAAAAPPPPVPAVVADDTILAPKHRWYARALPFDWSFHTENVLDPAHAVFAHHGVAGMDATNPHTFDLEVAEDRGRAGFTLRQKMHDPARRASYVNFAAPSLVHYTPDPESGAAAADPSVKAEARPGDPSGKLDTHLVFFATPLRPGWTLLLGTSAILDRATGKPSKMASIFGDALPAWLRHLLGGAFLAGDAYSLARASSTYAREGRDWRRSYFMPSNADVGIVALRTWMEQHGGGADVPVLPAVTSSGAVVPAPEDTLRFTREEAALASATKEQLLGRYDTHIKHCPACLTALHKTRATASAARTVALAAAAAAIVVATAAAQAALAAGSSAAPGWGAAAAAAIVAATRGAPLAAVAGCVAVAAAAALVSRAARALECAMLSSEFDREKHKFA